MAVGSVDPAGLPLRDDHQRAVGLDEAEARGACAEDRQDAADDALGNVADVQAARERLGDARDLLGLVLTPRRLAVEPRVLHRQRRLVGEGLQERRVRVGELADDGGGDEQHSDQLALGAERRRQERARAGLLEPPLEVVGQRERRVREDVAGGDGPPLGDHAVGKAGTGLDDVAGLELGRRRARPGDGFERPVGAQEAQARRVHAEDGQDALHDPVGDLRDVEAFGQHAGAFRQLLGLPAAARRLREEAGVAHGDGGLRGEGRQDLAVVLGRQVLAGQVERQHAKKIVARHDRDTDEGEEPARDRPLLGLDALVARDVLDEERLPVGGDPAGAPHVERQRRRQIVGVDGRVGRPGAAHQTPVGAVHLPEDDVARAGQLGEGERNLLQELLEVEVLRQGHVDVGQRAKAQLARGELGLGLPPRIQRAVEMLGELRQLVPGGHRDGRPLRRLQVAGAADERAHGTVHPVADEPGDQERHHRGRAEADKIAPEPTGRGRVGHAARHRVHDNPRRPVHSGRADQLRHAAGRSPLGCAAVLAEQRSRLGNAAQVVIEEFVRAGRPGQDRPAAGDDGDGLPTAERQRGEIEREGFEVDLGADDTDDPALALLNGDHQEHHLPLVRGTPERPRHRRLATPQDRVEDIPRDEGRLGPRGPLPASTRPSTPAAMKRCMKGCCTRTRTARASRSESWIRSSVRKLARARRLSV